MRASWSTSAGVALRPANTPKLILSSRDPALASLITVSTSGL
jgi:hypothetical protein